MSCCSHLCSVVWSLLANGTVIAWNPYTRERISTVSASHMSVVLLVPWHVVNMPPCMALWFVTSHILYVPCYYSISTLEIFTVLNLAPINIGCASSMYVCMHVCVCMCTHLLVGWNMITHLLYIMQ